MDSLNEIELKNYLDTEDNWDTICKDIMNQFILNDADTIVLRVDDCTNDGNKYDTEYFVTSADRFYKVLDSIVSCKDNKNGYQLYTNHFRITGGSGIEITKIYFATVNW